MSKDIALGPGGLDLTQSLLLTSYVASCLTKKKKDLICKMGMIAYTCVIGSLRGSKELNVCRAVILIL